MNSDDESKKYVFVIFYIFFSTFPSYTLLKNVFYTFFFNLI